MKNTVRPTARLRRVIDALGFYGAAKRWKISFVQTKRLAQGVGAVNVGTALAIAAVEGVPVEKLFEEVR